MNEKEFKLILKGLKKVRHKELFEMTQWKEKYVTLHKNCYAGFPERFEEQKRFR